MLFRIIPFVLIVFCLACNSSTPAETNADTVTTTPPAAKIDTNTTRPSTSELGAFEKITASTELEILSFTKQTDTNANFYPNYSQACEKWTLSNGQIVQILRTSKALWGEEFIQLYQELPCSYAGSVNINGKTVRFAINAGATTTLFFKDSTVHLGYAKPDFKKFFLEGQQMP